MYTRGPDIGRERVLTRRHGNGDDGAVADARMLGRWCCRGRSAFAWWVGGVFVGRGEPLACSWVGRPVR